MATTILIDGLKSVSLLPSTIIPASFTPSYDLKVSFPSKTPSNGSLVRVSDVKDTPSVTFSAASDSASTQSFTLLLIDPDAPTPDDPKFAYWRHWVVTNIPSNSGSGDVKGGKTITQYLAPGPKDESGPHRYLFLLFKEPQGFGVEKSDVGGEEFVDRRSFGAKDFVEKWGLELVGVQWMRGVGDGWNGGKDEL
ncbi:PEBP-like protein [Didymella exigua CBS 183.55]|uniref:PEBP-like protein n=1 Tax=Didymella exigua CBS 183.55 TaxID=1150837 RepID=A0A6A5RB55_9PLEO|nr:PEBP-like protein [Didymella exigua CBS 183.55]KAF1923027.1 PEBP-like protein [Didymella exigua CBS 183.55]